MRYIRRLAHRWITGWGRQHALDATHMHVPPHLATTGHIVNITRDGDWWRWQCPHCGLKAVMPTEEKASRYLSTHLERHQTMERKLTPYTHEQMSMTVAERQKFNRQFSEAVTPMLRDTGFSADIDNAYSEEGDEPN